MSDTKHITKIRRLSAKASTMPPGPERRKVRMEALRAFGNIRRPVETFTQLYGEIDREYF